MEESISMVSMWKLDLQLETMAFRLTKNVAIGPFFAEWLLKPNMASLREEIYLLLKPLA
jgi:hypothetical protein